MYPVILDPPSFSGGDHSKSADDLVQSVTLGNGGPGGARKNKYTLIFLIFPWHFGRKKECFQGLPTGSLAVTGSDGRLAGPTPAALIAYTRN